MANPEENALPKGITEDDLRAAVVRSGYPLQAVVASQLNSDFGVTEEWGYQDRDTGEHRSLDIFAFRNLAVYESEDFHPSIALLVECKKSELPYVFFRRVVDRPVENYPRVVGTAGGTVAIRDLGAKMSTRVPVVAALGLVDFPVDNVPPMSTSFSRAQRKGKNLELSGSDPYNSIILPLAKSLDYVESYLSPRSSTGDRFYISAIFAICVLDAPMLLAGPPGDVAELALHPWIRVLREEKRKDSGGWHSTVQYFVDVVHASFLRTFVNDVILRWGETFGERARERERVLRNGASVPDLQNWDWRSLK